MKKIIAIAAALCFFVTGCGQIDPYTDENGEPLVTETVTEGTTVKRSGRGEYHFTFLCLRR